MSDPFEHTVSDMAYEKAEKRMREADDAELARLRADVRRLTAENERLTQHLSLAQTASRIHEEELAEAKLNNYPAYKREKVLRCGAESRERALREGLQELLDEMLKFDRGGRGGTPAFLFMAEIESTIATLLAEPPTKE